MKRLHNIGQYFEVLEGDEKVVTVKGQQRLEIKSVGPCVVWLQALVEGPTGLQPEGSKTLLDVVEGSEELLYAYDGPHLLTFEPSGKVFVRETGYVLKKPVKDAVPFVRLEKPGLYVDPLKAALQRQAVLNRIVQGRERLQADQYTRTLERRLSDLAAKIDKLTPAKPVAEPDSAGEADGGDSPGGKAA